MIDDSTLESIFLTADDITTVCEIYDPDAVPGTDGWDPTDALKAYAAVSGVVFAGVTYTQHVLRFGTINKTMGKEVPSTSVEFSNTTREVAQFDFTTEFEGCIMVIRIISRSQSVSLATSKIEFVGRCEKPEEGSKESITVKAQHVLGSLDVVVPRRKYAPIDNKGRVASDPEYEGFITMPQEGVTAYSVRESRRSPWGLLAGVVGFFFIKHHRTVTKTLQWSSFSDLDANKSVALILGWGQLVGVKIGYADVGSYLKTRTAFCDGEVKTVSNIRVLDSRLSIADQTIHYGKIGTLNGDDPTYISPGYYSRTVELRANLANSTIDVVDPCPDIVALIQGMLIPIPDGSGGWTTTDWSENPIAHGRYFLRSPDYYNLDAAWVDDDHLLAEHAFCDELLFNTETSDFTFVKEG